MDEDSSGTTGRLPKPDARMYAPTRETARRGEAGCQSRRATVSAALAVVFAGPSVASVLDRVQHEAQLQHEQGLHRSFAADPGHRDHEAETSRGDRGTTAAIPAITAMRGWCAKRAGRRPTACHRRDRSVSPVGARPVSRRLRFRPRSRRWGRPAGMVCGSPLHYFRGQMARAPLGIRPRRAQGRPPRRLRSKACRAILLDGTRSGRL